MYQVENAGQVIGQREKMFGRGRRLPRVSRNVMLLGLTSFFTDISAEMVATILPLYLVYGLGYSPLQYGVMDGLYQGVTAFVRVGGGMVADRWRRYKEVAAFGYGLSALCKLGFLAAGSVGSAIASVIVLDRTGKGIRTAPRDALISLSTAPARMATAFGVHRAMDTGGAMIGPLVAFALLALTPRAYDTVFVVSFCIALIGLGILLLFVQNRPDKPEAEARREPETDGESFSLRAAFGLLGSRQFQVLVLAGTALAIFTMSDGFLYLGLQRRLDFDARYLPLLYMGTAVVYMLLAVPVGRLADRVGRGRVFVGGYAMLLGVYASLLLPSLGLPSLFVYLLLLGAFYAATDGVLMALAGALVPESLRGSGLALLVTATSVGRLVASLLFGGLWTWFGLDVAVVSFGAGLVLAISFATLLLALSRRRVAYG